MLNKKDKEYLLQIAQALISLANTKAQSPVPQRIINVKASEDPLKNFKDNTRGLTRDLYKRFSYNWVTVKANEPLKDLLWKNKVKGLWAFIRELKKRGLAETQMNGRQGKEQRLVAFRLSDKLAPHEN